MTQRIPHGSNPTEVRQAIQRLKNTFFDDSADIEHDETAGFVADEHVAHSEVSISAGTGLTGGGTIAANRTLSLSHLGIQSLANPGADRIFFWDDPSGAAWLSVGAGLQISGTTLSVVASGVDHGGLSGLGDDDHTQYLLANGTRALTGNLAVNAAVTIDGRDISVDGAKLDGIEAGADVTDAANVATAGAAMAGGAFHDGFSDFVAAEHVLLPNTIGNVLSDHNLAAHTALGLLAASAPTVASQVLISTGEGVTSWSTAGANQYLASNGDSVVAWMNANVLTLLANPTGSRSVIQSTGASAIEWRQYLDLQYSPVNIANTRAIQFAYYPTITTTGSYGARGLNLTVQPNIPLGVTNSGAIVAAYYYAATTTAFKGTLATLSGQDIFIGQSSGTGTISDLFGFRFYPYFSTGAVTNAKIISIYPATGSNLPTTSSWGIYNEFAAYSYFAWGFGIASTLPPLANGTGVLWFGNNGATAPTMRTSIAGLYAKTISGATELFAINSAGDVKQLTGGAGTTDTYTQEALFLTATTTDAVTSVEFFVLGGERLTLLDGETWTFDIIISARETDGAGRSCGYQVKGVIERSGDATTLVDSDAFSWGPGGTPFGTCTVSADDTYEALKIEAIGVDATTIYWGASVRLVKSIEKK